MSTVSISAGSAASAAARRVRQRHARDVDIRRDAGSAAEFGEIAGKPVGHIHRRRRMMQHRLGQRIARLRQQITLLEMRGHAPDSRQPRGELCIPAQQHAERGIADRAGDDDAVARLWRSERRTIVPCGTVPKAVIETESGPGVRSVSPPKSGQP